MTQDISKELKCIVMRNGAEIWKEADRLDNLSNQLLAGKIGFIEIDKEVINAVDIVGIFSPQSMEEIIHRKNGEWKCSYGKWHEKFKKCECRINNANPEEVARFSRGF